MSDFIARWEKAVAAQPENELARFSLGKALFDAGRFADARGHFERALAKKPDWMMVQILVGRCHLALGEQSAAIAAFRRGHALAVAQNHEGPREEMEQVLAELGAA